MHVLPGLCRSTMPHQMPRPDPNPNPVVLFNGPNSSVSITLSLHTQRQTLSHLIYCQLVLLISLQQILKMLQTLFHHRVHHLKLKFCVYISMTLTLISMQQILKMLHILFQHRVLHRKLIFCVYISITLTLRYSVFIFQ